MATQTTDAPVYKGRNIRVPDETWLPATEKANAEGANISEIVRELLRRYVRGELDPRGPTRRKVK